MRSETRTKPKKLLWFVPHLGGGGAESHLVRVANALDRSQFACEIAVARGGGAYEPRVRDLPITTLGSARASSSTASLLRAVRPLRQHLIRTRPDVLCSVMGHANLVALAATAGLAQAPRLVLCAQNNPQRAFSGWHPVPVLVRFAMRHWYHRAERVVALSQGVAQGLLQYDPRLTPHLEVIPNAALDTELLALRLKPCPAVRPNASLLVACGRLNEQKNYPLLLQAVQWLNRSQPVFLWILGEGPLRPQLERQARKLGIGDKVQFWGFHSNPYPFMAAADAFVLSSDFEGFGNVLVEAMACGAPVVSTDCPYGPQEVIRSEHNGLLIAPGDALALGQAVQRVLQDESLRQRLIEAGHTTAERYRDTVIAGEYGALFRRVIAADGPSPGRP